MGTTVSPHGSFPELTPSTHTCRASPTPPGVPGLQRRLVERESRAVLHVVVAMLREEIEEIKKIYIFFLKRRVFFFFF